MSRRLYGYLRASKADRTRETSLSVDAQRTAIFDYAERKGETIVDWFVDDGATGATAAAFRLCSPPSPRDRSTARRTASSRRSWRLSRSIVDFGSLLDTSRRQKWSIAVLDLDTRTAIGRMVAGFLILFAQFERELIGERTSAALQEAKRRGVKLGRPIALAPESEARVLALRADGLTHTQFAAQLNAEGTPIGRPGRWHTTTVQRVLARNAQPASTPTPIEYAA